MRSWPAIFSALAVLALTGCVAVPPPPPPPPLMSPYPAGGYGYGYAEERIGPDLLRVVYYGPLRPLDYYGVQHRAELDRAAGEAADLALWRAAQLALAEGRPAFAIIERRADTETLRRPGYFDDPWWPHHCWPYGPSWACGGWPPAYYPPAAEGRARATLTVRLENRATGRNIDAAATIRRFEGAYSPPAPPTRPPPGPPPASPPNPPRATPRT
jgi:hypothetical protein